MSRLRQPGEATRGHIHCRQERTVGQRANQMSKSKATKRWTDAELDRLRSLLDTGKTAREIAVELDRTPLAIYGQVQRIYRKRDPAKARRDRGDPY